MTTPSPSEEDHPGLRPAKEDDPMEMTGAMVAGDALAMLDGIIEEFAGIGHTPEEVARLFDDPFYRATHALQLQLGADVVRAHVRRIFSRRGVMRFESNPLSLIDGDASNP